MKVAVIDANVIRRAFKNKTHFLKILTSTHILKAPPYVVQEVLGFKETIQKEANVSSIEFDNIWREILNKIILEEPSLSEKNKALQIAIKLELDLKDVKYLALCCRYAPATFWTYDTPFVFGEKAQILRDKYGIYGNFNVS